MGHKRKKFAERKAEKSSRGYNDSPFKNVAASDTPKGFSRIMFKKQSMENKQKEKAELAANKGQDQKGNKKQAQVDPKKGAKSSLQDLKIMPGEKLRDFSRRVDEHMRDTMMKTNKENTAAGSKKKKYFEKLKAKKVDKRLKTQEEKAYEDFETIQDRVRLNDVAQAPPSLTSVPKKRRSDDHYATKQWKNTPGEEDYDDLVGEADSKDKKNKRSDRDDEENKAKRPRLKNMTPAGRRIIEEERKQAIENYRLMKARKTVERADASADGAFNKDFYPDKDVLQNTSLAETFFGIEKTETNIYFAQAAVISTVAHIVLFYLTWLLVPSLGKDRRRLAWVCSIFCSSVFFVMAMIEALHLRTTLYDRLGWTTTDMEGDRPINVISFLVPRMAAWIKRHALADGSTVLAGQTATAAAAAAAQQSCNMLQRFATLLHQTFSLPIFSLAPLSPTQRYSESAPYYFGGGGRLLISMENYPHESFLGAASPGIFVEFCMADLVLGSLHYPKEVDPLSGWVHHIAYTILAARVAAAKDLSTYCIAGGPLESPSGGRILYSLSLSLHCFWFYKYCRGRARRARRAKAEAEKAAIEAEAKKSEEKVDASGPVAQASATARRTVQLRFGHRSS
ncbi:hypothetical protein BGW38_000544, partial [Lunasporangiospora selenospora]